MILRRNLRLDFLVWFFTFAYCGIIVARAAVLGESSPPELTADEIAALQETQPEWFDEFSPAEKRPVVYRGDIALALADEAGAGGGGGAAGALTSSGRKWPGGVVYYQFNSNVNSTNRGRFVSAASEWTSAADIEFINSTGNGNYIEVLSDTTNSSFLGMIGGRQQLRMRNWSYRYIIAHEIAHALGMYHEQSRSDRDSYVSIHTHNIVSGAENNFAKRSTVNYGDYDFDSIMHYRRNSFLRSGLPNSYNTIDGSISIDLSHIPYLSYDLIVYADGAADGSGGTAAHASVALQAFDGSGADYWIADDRNWDGRFVQALGGEVSGATPGANFAIFRNLDTPSISLLVTAQSGSAAANGLQIIGRVRAALKLTYFAAADGNVSLSFSTDVDRTYRVVTSPDLQTWTPVGGHTGILGDGDIISRQIDTDILPPVDAQRRYFRIEEE